MIQISRVIGNKLLIKPEPKKDKSEGGILVPTSGREDRNSCIGEVLMLGTEVKSPVSVGSRVFYDGLNSIKIQTQEGELEIIAESQIHAILRAKQA